MQSNKEKNLIVDLTFSFALKIIKYAELLSNYKRYVLATQLLKSGTSIGAHVREAQNAESKPDFIHKMKTERKQMRQNTGCCFVIIQMVILNAVIF